MPKLTFWQLVMMTVISVDSIRNFPSAALFGGKIVVLYIAAMFFFLLPAGLVAAELSARFGDQKMGGGIYVWVRSALSPRIGMQAAWLQWLENVIWYPTILAFVSSAIGYIVCPQWADSPYFICVCICLLFWGMTAYNLRGVRMTAILSTFSVWFGLFLPIAIFALIAMYWLHQGHQMEISFTREQILPDFALQDWVALSGIMLSFAGIEIATVHVSDVDNPCQVFPKALMLSAVIICVTLLLGSLAVAMVVPSSELSLVAGVMQAYEIFYSKVGLVWLLVPTAAMLVIGGLGGIANWIVAPSKSFLLLARDGLAPAYFAVENQHGMPHRILMLQALLVSVLSLAFLFSSTVNSCFWLLTVVASQLYMYMYFIVFVSYLVIKCREKIPGKHFMIPGGKIGGCFCACLGIVGSLFPLFMGFVQPQEIEFTMSAGTYSVVVFLLFVVLAFFPYLYPDKQAEQQ